MLVGQAGDAMEAGGLQRCRQAHRRREGGEATPQPRLACPWGAEEQEVIYSMPASPSSLGPDLRGMSAMAADLAPSRNELWRAHATPSLRPHWITSSAWKRSVGGIARPRA